MMTISCKSGHRVLARANCCLLYDWAGHCRVSVWDHVKWWSESKMLDARPGLLKNIKKHKSERVAEQAINTSQLTQKLDKNRHN